MDECRMMSELCDLQRSGPNFHLPHLPFRPVALFAMDWHEMILTMSSTVP
jgi:hypothetical protein